MCISFPENVKKQWAFLQTLNEEYRRNLWNKKNFEEMMDMFFKGPLHIEKFEEKNNQSKYLFSLPFLTNKSDLDVYDAVKEKLGAQKSRFFTLTHFQTQIQRINPTGSEQLEITATFQAIINWLTFNQTSFYIIVWHGLKIFVETEKIEEQTEKKN